MRPFSVRQLFLLRSSFAISGGHLECDMREPRLLAVVTDEAEPARAGHREAMTTIAYDLLKKTGILLAETLSSFRKNNDLSAASSLAFSATLALIPSLFLLTFMLSAAIGSSGEAMARTQELLLQLIPAYSQDILHEVQSISSHLGTIGLLNGLVLLWSMTPLVAELRVALGTVFRKKNTRPFLLEMLFDLVISIVFLIGLTAIAVAGIVFTLAEQKRQLRLAWEYFEGAVPFLFITAVVFLLYLVFSKRRRLIHLAAGALVTSLLWFAMRPAFHLFLLYNPGYGFAFGSFKSLFVVIIWIYYSLVVFLIGAELAANLGRDETIFIKKLMEGGQNVPSRIMGKYVNYYDAGSVIFREGDPGTDMYAVRKGRVAIRRGGEDLGVVTEGKCFGEMSFLLSSPRVVTAVALEDVELAEISNENISNLMNEYPEFVVEMLRDMAERVREYRETNKLID
jgi:membrane protein